LWKIAAGLQKTKNGIFFQHLASDIEKYDTLFQSDRYAKHQYNHLYYFWCVAYLGSVSKAGAELGLAKSTVSAQLKSLETDIGERLYERRGRSPYLTQAGAVVFRYARQMFELGGEMCQFLEGQALGNTQRLRLGVVDTLPKVLVYKLLKPMLSAKEQLQLYIIADKAERLLADLSIHAVDAVLSDCPIPPSIDVRAYNHLLEESGISFVVARKRISRPKKSLLEMLTSTPALLPSPASALRAHLDAWFARNSISPHIGAEFQDSALMKLFGMHGHGIFPIPTLVENEVCREYHCATVGRIDEPIAKIYLITTERRVRSRALSRVTHLSYRLYESSFP